MWAVRFQQPQHVVVVCLLCSSKEIGDAFGETIVTEDDGVTVGHAGTAEITDRPGAHATLCRQEFASAIGGICLFSPVPRRLDFFGDAGEPNDAVGVLRQDAAFDVFKWSHPRQDFGSGWRPEIVVSRHLRPMLPDQRPPSAAGIAKADKLLEHDLDKSGKDQRCAGQPKTGEPPRQDLQAVRLMK